MTEVNLNYEDDYKPTFYNKISIYRKKINNEDKKNYDELIELIEKIGNIPYHPSYKPISLIDFNLFKTQFLIAKSINKSEPSLSDLKKYLNRDYVRKNVDTYLIKDIHKLLKHRHEALVKQNELYNCKPKACVTIKIVILQLIDKMAKNLDLLDECKKINNKTLDIIKKIIDIKNQILDKFIELDKPKPLGTAFGGKRNTKRKTNKKRKSRRRN